MSDAVDAVVEGLRQAYAEGDRELLASLLDPAVTWGFPGGDRYCANKKQVLTWFDGLWRNGLRGTVTGVEREPGGLVLIVAVESPQGTFTVRQRMTVAGDRVTSIKPDEAFPE